MFRAFESISVGETQSIVKRITEADVRKFVEMTGDDNPLHVDRSYAERTSFKDIVVHGMLGASFISTVIGTRIPGPGALWVSQNMEFLLPVRLGDELTITCTVVKKHERDRLLELDTRIHNQQQQLVLTGQGKVKVMSPPAEPAATARVERARVAIVTGATGGIGRAICERLAADGYHVVINTRGQLERAKALATELTRGDVRAIAVQADVSTEAGVESLVDAARRAFGSVGVLVNNASPRINPKPWSVLEWSDVQAQLDVQLKGALLLTKACAPDMVARKWGRVVNVTSQVVDGAPTPGWTGYAVAKAALAMLSRHLAGELGPHGITVNCVAPGMCETPLIGDIPEKAQLMIARQTPLRRLARPGDVAAAVAQLVSDDSDFVTGATHAVNGGVVMS